MIKNTDHCALCDLKQTKLNLGLICSLTNSPPNFNKTCSNITLNIIFNRQTSELKEKTEELNFSKYIIFQNLVMYGLAGVFTLVLCFIYYVKKIRPYGILRIDVSPYGAASTFGVLALLFILGFGLIGKGVKPLLEYNQVKKNTNEKIDKIASIIQLYNLKSNQN